MALARGPGFDEKTDDAPTAKPVLTEAEGDRRYKQPQLTNVEYLIVATRFVVDSNVKTGEPALTIETALWFTDQQQLGNV